MEIFYLLGSIASTLVTSCFLSLLLTIRSLYRLSSLLSPSPINECNPHAAVQVYEGHVLHIRTKPVSNSFEYPVRYALYDLDRAPRNSNLSADRAREAAGTNGPVFLLTIPPSVGYEQNPINVYYCYELGEEGGDEGGSSPCLKNCIAEVTNTPWGEKVLFEFCLGSDIVAKHLHVSPFMDMLGSWTIHSNEPGESLFISISVQHPTLGNYFFAELTATRVHSSNDLLTLDFYFWLMPHRVAMWIYWQAVKLWWKKVPFIGHPKYSNSSYRDDSLSRGFELCPLRKNRRCMDDKNQSSCAASRNRWCIWRDAKWPWA